MNNMKNNRPAPSPFDSAAIDRLRRMSLATAEGTVERDAMAVFCNIFAGQFYDDLCDYYQDDPAEIRAALAPLLDGAYTGDPHGKFLMICLQYDSIYRTLPDPIWWLSGSPAFAEFFADGFLAHLARLGEIT